MSDQDEDEMSCEAFKELAAAFALSVLDPREQTGCARHLLRAGPHAGCAEAVAEAQTVAVKLAAALPPRTPPPRVWRAIEARLPEEPGDPPEPNLTGRRLAELGSWLVVATVLGVYLYGAAPAPRRRNDGDPAPSLPRAASGLAGGGGAADAAVAEDARLATDGR